MKAGGTAGVKPLVLSTDEGFRDSQEVADDGRTGRPATTDEVAIESRSCSKRPNAARPTSCIEPARTASSTPMRHSAAHVMAEAVLDLFPGTKLGIGPAIDDGFYYDFELPRPLTPDDLAAIEARMRESIAADHPFERRELSPAEARAFLVERDQPFKVEIIDDLLPRPSATATPMPPTTLLPSRARSSTCAGARTSRAPARSGRSSCWRSPAPTGAATRSARCSSASTARPGRRRRSSTQYLWRREEAKKRDHRRLGVQLDLFSFHDVTPGSAFWHPKGQRIWRTLEGGDARAPGAARLPGGQHADRRRASGCGGNRATGTSTRQHVPRSSRRTRRSASSR